MIQCNTHVRFVYAPRKMRLKINKQKYKRKTSDARKKSKKNYYDIKETKMAFIYGIQRIIQESLANAKVSTRQPCWSKTDFDAKLALKVILGQCHSFCNQLQADKGYVILLDLCRTFPKK